MKHQFKTVKFNSGTNAKLLKVMEILKAYDEAGYVLTLRQLYYQLVSRDIIPNNLREYSKLSYLMVKARMGGLVDWSAIEDRVRLPDLKYWVEDIPDALEDTIKHYRLNRQRGQANYLEVWCEKDALSGVLKRVTHEYHIMLCVNRGYSSATAMYDAAKRLKRAKQKSHILYLGDHDPSGLDMIRDIEQRLSEFGCYPEIHRIALTSEQIEEYDPPPNPAKWTDTRAEAYVAEFGETCWEVDALPPEVLNEILTDSIEQLIDTVKFEDMKQAEQHDKERLEEIIDNIREES